MFTLFNRPDPPEPIVALVNHLRHAGQWISAVTRVWPPGTGYCGRCPRECCLVEQDVCLVVVSRYVEPDDACDLETWDLRQDGPRGGPSRN